MSDYQKPADPGGFLSLAREARSRAIASVNSGTPYSTGQVALHDGPALCDAIEALVKERDEALLACNGIGETNEEMWTVIERAKETQKAQAAEIERLKAQLAAAEEAIMTTNQTTMGRKWKCPRCGDLFAYSEDAIADGCTVKRTPAHACGPQFVAARYRPRSESERSFWSRVKGWMHGK